jgi:hypothetical protein
MRLHRVSVELFFCLLLVPRALTALGEIEAGSNQAQEQASSGQPRGELDRKFLLLWRREHKSAPCLLHSKFSSCEM